MDSPDAQHLAFLLTGQATPDRGTLRDGGSLTRCFGGPKNSHACTCEAVSKTTPTTPWR